MQHYQCSTKNIFTDYISVFVVGGFVSIYKKLQYIYLWRFYMRNKKKKLLLSAAAISSLAVAGLAAFAFGQNDVFGRFTKADPMSYTMTLNSSSELESKDHGFYHAVTIKNNEFDVLGYSAVSGKFGKIKKQSYNGVYDYNGMIYNRSVINGFKSLTVSFSGGDLYYVFSDFLMEDMSFDKSLSLQSNVAVNVPNNEAYFVVYTDSTTGVDINSLTVEYSCDSSIDDQMIFTKADVAKMGGARSLAKRATAYDSYVELENNPTIDNNNYSTGKITGGNAKSWYRWNGKYFINSQTLGNNFSFGMTVVGNISQVVNSYENQFDNFFHYAVWPQFEYAGMDESLIDSTYIQTYIGNDNYEPLGAENALHPSNPYVSESYAGRFFSDYGWYDDTWKFPNPDTTYTTDGVTTFRQAYEANTLPFWYIRFDVRVTGDNYLVCDVNINGYKLFTRTIFDDPFESPEAIPNLYIARMPLHCVNYGKDAEGNPANSYVGTFTYPRLIEYDEIYLKCSANDWSQKNNSRFSIDPKNSNHYFIEDVSLNSGDQIKANDITNNKWYGVKSIYENCGYTVGADNNCVVSKTGTYDIDLWTDSAQENYLVLHLTYEPTPVYEHEYYVVLNSQSWGIYESNGLTVNPTDSNQYTIEIALQKNEEIKVYNPTTNKWYGSNENYTEQSQYWITLAGGNIKTLTGGTFTLTLYVEHNEGNHIKLYYDAPATSSLTFNVSAVTVNSPNFYLWAWGSQTAGHLYISSTGNTTTRVYKIPSSCMYFKLVRMDPSVTVTDYNNYPTNGVWDESDNVQITSTSYIVAFGQQEGTLVITQNG